MKCNGHTPAVFSLAMSRRLRDIEQEKWSQCQTPSGTETTLASLMVDEAHKADDIDFESLVSRYYRALYQFAYSLARQEAEASDLTQQTFYVWAKKGHQLRDASKVKTWLFTTLHREFLKKRRRDERFPHVELEQAENDVAPVSPTVVNQLDGASVIHALDRIEELYRAPLALFYLEEHSYKEIAEILAVPVGTVQSRIARGKAHLQRILLDFVPKTQTQPQKAQRG